MRELKVPSIFWHTILEGSYQVLTELYHLKE